MGVQREEWLSNGVHGAWTWVGRRGVGERPGTGGSSLGAMWQRTVGLGQAGCGEDM